MINSQTDQPSGQDRPNRGFEHLKMLCRGDGDFAKRALTDEGIESAVTCVATITVGCALFGATLGLWRAPLQAAYVGIKLPLLVGLTLLINGMVNGMLAQVLGSGLTFRQTLHGCLMSFAIFALITGSLSPVLLFMVLNAPPASAPEAPHWHAIFLLVNVFIIAIAGIAGNLKLFTVLQAFAGNAIVALRVLLAWLAGNLFVGAQLAWVLRPMMGNPSLDVQFIRTSPFSGNFYQDILTKMRIATGLSAESSTIMGIAFALSALLICIFGWQTLERKLRTGVSPEKSTNEPNQ